MQTSHGRVQTTITQSISFSNVQNFTITNSVYKQNIAQLTSITSQERTSTSDDSSFVRRTRQWPLNLAFNFTVNSDGTGSQATTVHQAKNETFLSSGDQTLSSTLSNTVDTSDTELFDASFNLTGRTNTKSSQHYVYSDDQGGSYNKTVTSANNLVTGFF